MGIEGNSYSERNKTEFNVTKSAEINEEVLREKVKLVQIEKRELQEEITLQKATNLFNSGRLVGEGWGDSDVHEILHSQLFSSRNEGLANKVESLNKKLEELDNFLKEREGKKEYLLAKLEKESNVIYSEGKETRIYLESRSQVIETIQTLLSNYPDELKAEIKTQSAYFRLVDEDLTNVNKEFELEYTSFLELEITLAQNYNSLGLFKESEELVTKILSCEKDFGYLFVGEDNPYLMLVKTVVESFVGQGKFDQAILVIDESIAKILAEKDTVDFKIDKMNSGVYQPDPWDYQISSQKLLKSEVLMQKFQAGTGIKPATLYSAEDGILEEERLGLPQPLPETEKDNLKSTILDTTEKLLIETIEFYRLIQAEIYEIFLGDSLENYSAKLIPSLDEDLLAAQEKVFKEMFHSNNGKRAYLDLAKLAALKRNPNLIRQYYDYSQEDLIAEGTKAWLDLLMAYSLLGEDIPRAKQIYKQYGATDLAFNSDELSGTRKVGNKKEAGENNSNVALKVGSDSFGFDIHTTVQLGLINCNLEELINKQKQVEAKDEDTSRLYIDLDKSAIYRSLMLFKANLIKFTISAGLNTEDFRVATFLGALNLILEEMKSSSFNYNSPAVKNFTHASRQILVLDILI